MVRPSYWHGDILAHLKALTQEHERYEICAFPPAVALLFLRVFLVFLWVFIAGPRFSSLSVDSVSSCKPRVQVGCGTAMFVD